MRLSSSALALLLLVAGCSESNSNSSAEAPAKSEESLPSSGNLEVDSFFRSIAKMDKAAAVAKVAKVESLIGIPLVYSTADAYVEALMKCSVKTAEQVIKMTRISLSCPDGNFVMVIDPNSAKPKLVLTDLRPEEPSDSKPPLPPTSTNSIGQSN